mmetsp:Transcript_84011/g.271877  ORF Transcript_84011/g.271877 Transcript_84011/m.271877 type:complete len:545 (-) Transcript_84011:234-1868(-)
MQLIDPVHPDEVARTHCVELDIAADLYAGAVLLHVAVRLECRGAAHADGVAEGLAAPAGALWVDAHPQHVHLEHVAALRPVEVVREPGCGVGEAKELRGCLASGPREDRLKAGIGTGALLDQHEERRRSARCGGADGRTNSGRHRGRGAIGIVTLLLHHVGLCISLGVTCRLAHAPAQVHLLAGSIAVPHAELAAVAFGRSDGSEAVAVHVLDVARAAIELPLLVHGVLCRAESDTDMAACGRPLGRIQTDAVPTIDLAGAPVVNPLLAAVCAVARLQTEAVGGTHVQAGARVAPDEEGGVVVARKPRHKALVRLPLHLLLALQDALPARWAVCPLSAPRLRPAVLAASVRAGDVLDGAEVTPRVVVAVLHGPAEAALATALWTVRLLRRLFRRLLRWLLAVIALIALITHIDLGPLHLNHLVPRAGHIHCDCDVARRALLVRVLRPHTCRYGLLQILILVRVVAALPAEIAAAPLGDDVLLRLAGRRAVVVLGLVQDGLEILEARGPVQARVPIRLLPDALLHGPLHALIAGLSHLGRMAMPL